MSLQLVSRRSCNLHQFHLPQSYNITKRRLNLPSHLHDLKLKIMHAKASVDGTVIAETDNFEYVEGNVYFPPDSIFNKSETLTGTSHTTSCPWKGEGHYYDIHVNGKTLDNAAWYYPHPLEKATHIKDYVAFCTYLIFFLKTQVSDWFAVQTKAKCKSRRSKHLLDDGLAEDIIPDRICSDGDAEKPHGLMNKLKHVLKG